MVNDNIQPFQDLLTNADYLRQRSIPHPGDGSLYLVSTDLRLALEQFRTDDNVRVLDFGCGGSPYRSLFANADYMRADVPGAHGVDYIIQSDSHIAASDKTFDIILSTQVVEHVRNTRAYFAECNRLLRPGGQLILSTHGTYEDHACPEDYQRWTAYGLCRDVQDAGFTVSKVLKLTTGPRAMLFFLGRGWLSARSLSYLACFFLPIKMMYRFGRSILHKLADRNLSAYRVVDDPTDSHVIYVGLLLSAVRQ